MLTLNVLVNGLGQMGLTIPDNNTVTDIRDTAGTVKLQMKNKCQTYYYFGMANHGYVTNLCSYALMQKSFILDKLFTIIYHFGKTN